MPRGQRGKFSLFSKTAGTLSTSAAPLVIENEQIVFRFHRNKEPLRIPLYKVRKVIVGKHKDTPNSARKFKGVLLLTIEAYKTRHDEMRKHYFLQRSGRQQSVYIFLQDLRKALFPMHKMLGLNDDEIYKEMSGIENKQDGQHHAVVTVLWRNFDEAFIYNLRVKKIAKDQFRRAEDNKEIMTSRQDHRLLF